MRDVSKELQDYELKHHQDAWLSRFSDITNNVVELFKSGRDVQGEPLPWRKTEQLFRFRDHELTIWAGYNSHGKSLLLSELMANSVTHHDAKWAVASFEMPLLRLAERFVVQCSGGQQPTEAYIRRCLKWTDDRIFVFDETDSVSPRRVLAFAEMAFDHLGCDHVVIDSLVKCGVDSRENEHQKRFIDALQHVAKHFGGHIHLVHHLRKTDSDERGIPSKQDLKGAGEIADLADNVVIVHRNKGKEARAQQKKEVDGEPDVRLLVEKQRHFEWSGSIALWFDVASQRYLEREGARRKWYGPAIQKAGHSA